MADPASPLPAIPSSLTPPSDHHRILSLTIEGGTHFPSFHADFSDGLNCLIGGRGAGKTAVLLHIAFALGFVTSPLSAQRSDAHLRSNLGVGRVTVKVRTSHGRVFTSRRSAGEPPCVRDDEGNVVPVSLNGELFKIDAYGQSEIEKMGDSPLAQLTLLDKFAAVDVKRATDAIAQIDRRLSTNAAEMKRLDGEIADAEESVGDLPSIEAALAGLDAAAGPDAAEAKRAHDAKVLRGRERAAIDTVAKEIATVERALAATTSEARRRLGSAVHAQLEGGANGALLTRVHLQAKTVADKLEQLQREIAATVALASAAVAVDQRALHVVHANADDVYKTLSLRIETDGKRVAERDKLQRRMVELSGLAKVLSDRRAEAATRATERPSAARSATISSASRPRALPSARRWQNI
jgi:AAA domain